MSLYEISAEAQSDLFDIWLHISQDSVELANRIEREFYELFASLGKLPHQGHTRKDLTRRPVLFFPLYSFLVVYEPDAKTSPNYGGATRAPECEADLERPPRARTLLVGPGVLLDHCAASAIGLGLSGGLTKGGEAMTQMLRNSKMWRRIGTACWWKGQQRKSELHPIREHAARRGVAEMTIP